jgi:hypothetical protein
VDVFVFGPVNELDADVRFDCIALALDEAVAIAGILVAAVG